MALNNFDAAGQPVAWARRGAFRESGFYEGPAEMAKALLSGRWKFTPERAVQAGQGVRRQPVRRLGEEEPRDDAAAGLVAGVLAPGRRRCSGS